MVCCAQRREWMFAARVTDEIIATIIDHVINHGLSYREAVNEYSQISAGTQWHPLLNCLRNQQVGYCMRASPTAKCKLYHVLQ